MVEMEIEMNEIRDRNEDRHRGTNEDSNGDRDEFNKQINRFKVDL